MSEHRTALRRKTKKVLCVFNNSLNFPNVFLEILIHSSAAKPQANARIRPCPFLEQPRYVAVSNVTTSDVTVMPTSQIKSYDVFNWANSITK